MRWSQAALFGTLGIVLPKIALAANHCFTPGVQIPGLTKDCVTFAEYFGAIYKYAIGIALVIAVIMTVIAGYIYATSGGDPGRLGIAKEIFTSTVIGLAVLVLAALIIRSIVAV
jgi:hypothetical protein